MITSCGYDGTANRFIIFPINAKTSTPTTVLTGDPIPPLKLAPPITQAAIQSSSNPFPTAGEPIPVLAHAIIPPIAEQNPEIA